MQKAGSREGGSTPQKGLSGRGVPTERLALLALRFVEAVLEEDEFVVRYGLDLADAVADLAEGEAIRDDDGVEVAR